MKLEHYKGPYNYYESWYYLDKDGNKINHRDDDLPAYTYSSGTKIWFQHGKLHRETGAAIEFCNGNSEYYYNGKLLGKNSEGYTQEQFEQYKKLLPFL